MTTLSRATITRLCVRDSYGSSTCMYTCGEPSSRPPVCCFPQCLGLLLKRLELLESDSSAEPGGTRVAWLWSTQEWQPHNLSLDKLAK